MELWLHQVPAHLQDTLGSAFQRRGVLQDVFKAEQMLLDYAESLAREIAAGRDEPLSLILLQWPPSRTCTFPRVLPFCKSLQTQACSVPTCTGIEGLYSALYNCQSVLLCCYASYASEQHFGRLRRSGKCQMNAELSAQHDFNLH